MSARRIPIILKAVAILIGLFVAVGVLLPVFGRPSFVDPLLRQAFRSRTLVDTLVRYAEDHDGKFPAKINDLVPEYMPEGFEFLQFQDLRTKEQIDWIYFGSHTIRDRRDTIFMASPKTFSKEDGTRTVGAGVFRFVITIDGRGVILTENDYQACIAEQQQPGWTSSSGLPINWDLLASARERSIAESAKQTVRSEKHSSKDIPGLIRKLRVGDRTNSEEAAGALGEIGAVTPEAVSALVDALSSEATAFHAAHALAAISLYDPMVAPALLDVMSKNTPGASAWAIVALNEMGPVDESFIPLLRKALELGSSDLRSGAAKTVVHLSPSAQSLVPALIDLLTNQEDRWSVKCAAIQLGRIGPAARQAIPALTTRWNAGDSYKIDMARALWKIDPAQATHLVPALVAALEAQRNPDSPNQQTNGDFVSIIALLGEIGPEARSAIPILQLNLQGGARMHAAWALWRIDPTLADAVDPVLLRFLDDRKPPDRLDRLVQGSRLARSISTPREEIFGPPFGPRLAAAGMLWQMHPEKRESLQRLIAALLDEWNSQKVLKEMTPETEAAVPALVALEKERPPLKLQFLARAALRKIATTDYGDW